MHNLYVAIKIFDCRIIRRIFFLAPAIRGIRKWLSSLRTLLLFILFIPFPLFSCVRWAIGLEYVSSASFYLSFIIFFSLAPLKQIYSWYSDRNWCPDFERRRPLLQFCTRGNQANIITAMLTFSPLFQSNMKPLFAANTERVHVTHFTRYKCI